MLSKYIAAILVITSSPTLASNWVKVTVDEENGVWSIDIDSIRTLNGGYRQAWRKVTKVSKQSNEVVEDLVLSYYNCSNRTRAMKTAVLYYNNGKNASKTVPDYGLEWNPVVPDTVGETAFNFVCKQPM
jgi:hypothetical protein